jgi:superfamily II DNA helicase RecQ
MEISWSLQDEEAAAAVETFKYLEEHKLIVCREHGYALRNLDRHLVDYHVYPRSIRKTISRLFNGVAFVFPEDAPLPKAYGPPIEHIAPPRVGFLCDETECGFISISRTRTAQHCNGHGWRSSHDEKEHWTRVWVQSFCSKSGKQRWFVVRVEGKETTADAEPIPDDVLAKKKAMLEGFGKRRAERKLQIEIIDAEIAQTDQTGWWKRTDWVTHLGESNLRHLAHAARLPDKDEPWLKVVADSVDEMIEECVKGLASLPQEIRRWLKSAKMEEVDQRPMGRLQNQTSQDRYANYWKRLICYSLRVARNEQGQGPSRLEDRQSHDEDGDEIEEDGDESEDDREGYSSEDDGAETRPVVRGDKMKDARRLFPWRDGQKELATRLINCVETGTGSVTSAVLDFSRSFIFHKVYHKPFESPMLHFMAVLGIDEENNRLKEANDYSYMLAGLVYCIRVIGLELLLPSKNRQQQADADYETFLQQRRQFLADGSMSVASNMISLLAYGKHIALNYGNAGGVFWEDEAQALNLHGARIPMEKFKAMVGRAIDDAEDLFWQRLMWTADPADRLALDLNMLTDDITFRRRDSYFVDNKRNGLASKWEDVTIDRLLMSRNGRKMYSDGKWHTRLAREYLREVDKFRKLLLFCVHVTGGQPARGSEILSLRFKNGCVRDRNIFLLDGYVMSVTFYNKTQAEWDVPKVIPRFLPWRVGQLLSLYLVYVQPLAELISVETGYGCGWSEYIWGDNKGPWETPKLTSILRQRTGSDIGHALGTLQFRHAAVGIGRQVVGDEFAKGYKDETGEVEEPEMEEGEDPLEVSAGRSSATGVNRYAVRSDIVRHLSQRNIDTFRPLSESWHRFLGLQSRNRTLQTKTQKRKGGEMETPEAKKTSISWTGGLMTPAATLGSRATSKQGPLVTPFTAITDSRRSALVQSSPLQGFGATALPSSPPVASSPTRSSRPVRLKIGLEEREKAVRKALGLAETTTVAYKSAEQEEALERIINGSDSALAVVLPTGGGKSLLFTAPACLDDPGITIVAVPYRQLIEETLSDARDRGIDAVEWSRDLSDPADIVFISADKLGDTFFDYSARMAGKGLVRRVFVDECHLAITAHSWRPRLVSLARLRCIEAPTIMLTATLPLHMETDLETTMRCELSLTLIRACTARRTTRYIVRADVEDGKLMQEAIEVCSKQLSRLPHKSKMVVYCRSKAECQELAAALGCNYFFSGSADNAEVIEMWKEAGGCVVATTALGTGVNYTGVALAVHIGMPYGFIDFAQESGRAGRGGEVVTSLILVERDWQTREAAKRTAVRREWSPDEKAMLDFVNTGDCRRLVLGRYFDRKPAQDCVTGEMERCDRCCSGVSDWARSEKETSKERETVEDALDQMANGCPVCWVTAALGSGCGWMHDGKACSGRQTIANDTGDTLDVSEVACDRFRATVRYLDGGKTCHACGISQKMCRTRESGQGGCQWPRIAPAILMMVTTNTFGRNIVRQTGFLGELGDWKSYALWLGQPHRLRLWGELVSNSMVVIKDFLVYCRQEMKNDPWDDEGSIDEEIAEALCGGEEAPVQTESRRASRDQTESSGAVTVLETDEDEGDKGVENEGNISNERKAAGHSLQRRRWRKEPRVMGSDLDPARLRELTDEWSEQCAVCKVNGKIARGHRHWSDCKSQHSGLEKMSEAIKVLEDVQFASFAHCKWCYRSQAVCEMWARSVGWQGRVVFKKKPGVDCMYGRWVLEAAAAFLAFGADGGLEEWRSRDPSLAALKQEMGKKYRRGEVEFSGLFGYFYTWA